MIKKWTEETLIKLTILRKVVNEYKNRIFFGWEYKEALFIYFENYQNPLIRVVVALCLNMRLNKAINTVIKFCYLQREFGLFLVFGYKSLNRTYIVSWNLDTAYLKRSESIWKKETRSVKVKNDYRKKTRFHFGNPVHSRSRTRSFITSANY